MQLLTEIHQPGSAHRCPCCRPPRTSTSARAPAGSRGTRGTYGLPRARAPLPCPPGQLVQRLAIALDRRIHGRQLLDLAAEAARAASMAARQRGGVDCLEGSPSASPVVVLPRGRNVLSYALSASSRYWENLVASPKHSGRTPVASGSRLPVWPALAAPNRRLARCRAWLELSPRACRATECPTRAGPGGAWPRSAPRSSVGPSQPAHRRRACARIGLGGPVIRASRSRPRPTLASKRSAARGTLRIEAVPRDSWLRRKPAAPLSTSVAGALLLRSRSPAR
jgi:hypothetical protein